MIPMDKTIRVSDVKAHIKVYENDSVLFLHPELPTWVRSSVTGMWLYRRLMQKPCTVSELIQNVVSRYDIPESLASEHIKAFVEEMVYHHFFAVSDEQMVREGVSPGNVKNTGLQELWLDITSFCQGACQHCYKPRSSVSHLPLHEVEMIIGQAARRNVQSLTISGGDPLLHPDIKEIVRRARGLFPGEIKIITAGHNITPSVVHTVVENTDIIQVSMDGIDEITNDAVRGVNAFKHACLFIKFVQNSQQRDNIRLGLSFTPLPENIEQIPKLDQFAYRMGIEFLHFNHPRKSASPSIDEGRERQYLSKGFFQQCMETIGNLNTKIWLEYNDTKGLERVKPLIIDPSYEPYYDLFNPIKKENCGAGMTTMAINERGDVFPCASLQNQKDAHIGNWYEQRNLDLLYHRGRQWNEHIFSVDRCITCRSCSFKYVCGGGCRARGRALDKEDQLCSSITWSYDKFFRYFGVRRKQSIEQVAEETPKPITQPL